MKRVKAEAQEKFHIIQKYIILDDTDGNQVLTH